MILTAKNGWKLADAWNAVSGRPVTPPQKRNYVWASEIGQPLVDRFLRMNGVPYTNPANLRAQRKMWAGLLTEEFVKVVLQTTGLFEGAQIVINERPYSDCLPVHGKCDFKTIAGEIDVERALAALYEIPFSADLLGIGKSIIESLKGIWLTPKLLEVKSVSGLVFDTIERRGAPIRNHPMQGYHYQKNGRHSVDLAYISRDDLRIIQFPIHADACEEIYREDLKQMTYYYESGERPPIEPVVKFEYGRFSKSIMVEYSPYLTPLYGYSTPDEYRQSVSYVTSWNSVIKRYAMAEMGAKTPTGKPIAITPKNKEIREAIIKAGYDWNDIIQQKIAAGNEPDENEDE